jgi:hypothetical protein
VNWIAADIVRLKDGMLVEHWDVIQDEATEQQSKSGNPMFGDSFRSKQKYLEYKNRGAAPVDSERCATKYSKCLPSWQCTSSRTR